FTEDMLNGDLHLPELKILNLDSIPDTTSDSHMNFRLKTQDIEYTLDRINVWVNHVAVYGTKGVKIQSADLNVDTKDINVPLSNGHNLIEFSVLNRAGVESYREQISVYCTAGKETPNLYL